MNTTFNYMMLTANILFVSVYLAYLFKIKAFTMNAKPLTHQHLFKAAIIIPIVSFFLLGAISWEGHSLQIDSEGFNNFLDISKLPLAALSLSLPLGVIVNNIHRTIQTDKQIEEAERKNILDRYYSHRKNTIEILQNLDMSTILILNKEVPLAFENSYSTYKKFYPSASTESNNYTPSQRFLTRSRELWVELNELTKITTFSTKKDYFTHLTLIEESLYKIHCHYGLKKIEVSQLYNIVFVNEDGKKYDFRTMIYNEHCLKMNIAAYWLATRAIADLLEVQLYDEFLEEMHDLVNYAINVDKKYTIWATNLVNAKIPQIFQVGPF
ncbi:hypothetical protein [Cronobacter sakazakii]|uniref:hypothetical protein n=1 Tax=Cronobacter sakazakii TaxID=28141 RepID=UPI0013760526|nr:hypothetical protein [Cronobacter sakazakii]NCH42616.1 hypothetical protein [Cronobacter sakazakii]